MTTAYPYISTPSLILHSSTDWTVRCCIAIVLYCIVDIVLLYHVIRYCYDDTTEFWQQWQAELAGVAREIAAARPEFGVDILSCPFHGAVNWAWDYLEVATQHHKMLQLLELQMNHRQDFHNQGPY